MLKTLFRNVSQLLWHDDSRIPINGQCEGKPFEVSGHRTQRTFGMSTVYPKRFDGTCDPEDLKFLESSFPELTDFQFLGKGGFGTAFSANQAHMNRRVAVKLLHNELVLEEGFAERFQNEARAQARVPHPNIVTVFDAGIRGGRPYIIMEYVPNGTLRNRISSRPFSSREALLMLQQLCDALERSHGASLIHRDIKPENILIDQHGNLKLSDFGLASVVSEAQEAEKNIDYYYAGANMNYMAPELMSRPWAADARTDLYAVIVVFYEAIMGEIPRGSFEAPSSRSRMIRSLRTKVDAIVFRGLQSNPNRRFQTAIELRNHVDAIIEDPRLTRRVSMKWALNKEEIRKYWLVAALGIMFLQTAFMGYFYVRNIRKLDRQKSINNQAMYAVKQKEEALAAVEAELKKNKEDQLNRTAIMDLNEVNAVIQFSENAAWLKRDFLVNDLSADERMAINRILFKMHQEYLQIELANTSQEVRSDETIVSTVRSSYEQLGELEVRFWSEVDGVVSVATQKLLRDTIPLFADSTTLVMETPGNADSRRLESGTLTTNVSGAPLDSVSKSRSRGVKRLFPSKLRYPQLFGWGPEDMPIRISVRRKGMWFAWSIEQSLQRTATAGGSRQQPAETFRVVDSGEAPTIPMGLRRFWWDPSIGTDKSAAPVAQSPAVDVLSLRSPNSSNLPGATVGITKPPTH